MRHCCAFSADDIYYLVDTDICSGRKLSIGFCPICSKPVAELFEVRFDGLVIKQVLVGIKANDLMIKLKDEILYSMKKCNYLKFKSKPFGWKYGVNRNGSRSGKPCVRQYAYDFYGNKVLVKRMNERNNNG